MIEEIIIKLYCSILNYNFQQKKEITLNILPTLIIIKLDTELKSQNIEAVKKIQLTKIIIIQKDMHVFINIFKDNKHLLKEMYLFYPVS